MENKKPKILEDTNEITNDIMTAFKFISCAINEQQTTLKECCEGLIRIQWPPRPHDKSIQIS